MEEIEEYRHDLWNEVLELARDRDIYDQEAFFETACEILRDSEAITAYHPAYCRYLMGTNKALAIDGLTKTPSNWTSPSWLSSVMTN